MKYFWQWKCECSKQHEQLIINLSIILLIIQTIVSNTCFCIKRVAIRDVFKLLAFLELHLFGIYNCRDLILRLISEMVRWRPQWYYNKSRSQQHFVFAFFTMVSTIDVLQRIIHVKAYNIFNIFSLNTRKSTISDES